MKKEIAVMIMLSFIAALSGCGRTTAAPVQAEESTAALPALTLETEAPVGGYHPVFSDLDLKSSWDDSTATHITLSGTAAQVEGEGAAALDGGVRISEGGTYILEGTLEDGRIVADVEPGETLTIVLNGVSITSSTSAPLYIANGDAVIVLPEGTTNVLMDAAEYQYPNEFVTEPNACVYGDDCISIVGSGALEIRSNFNNGIGSKDELRIAYATITVKAVNNALKGNDCVLIRDAVLNLNSEGDGIKSDEKDMEGYGLIEILGSSVSINAKDDALQATSRIAVPDGEILAAVHGKKINCDGVIAIAEGVLK